MKWVTLVLQLLSVRNSFFESRAMIDGARAAAERGKRAALFSVACLVAAIYFLVGSILFVLELCLQADRGEFLRLSGLLGGSIVLMVVSALIVGAGALAFGAPKDPPAAPPRPEGDIRGLAEELVATFLGRMIDRLKDRPKKDEHARGA